MALKKYLYKIPRYWYHVSSTLNRRNVKLTPRDDSVGRAMDEPPGARICVAPSIEQCITALPYCVWKKYYIYRTENKIIASRPLKNAIYDGEITQEGWILEKMNFIKLGSINFDKISAFLIEKNKEMIDESASGDSIEYSKEVLRWWKRVDIKKFIEYT